MQWARLRILEVTSSFRLGDRVHDVAHILQPLASLAGMIQWQTAFLQQVQKNASTDDACAGLAKLIS